MKRMMNQKQLLNSEYQSKQNEYKLLMQKKKKKIVFLHKTIKLKLIKKISQIKNKFSNQLNSRKIPKKQLRKILLSNNNKKTHKLKKCYGNKHLYQGWKNVENAEEISHQIEFKNTRVSVKLKKNQKKLSDSLHFLLRKKINKKNKNGKNNTNNSNRQCVQ